MWRACSRGLVPWLSGRQPEAWLGLAGTHEPGHTVSQTPRTAGGRGSQRRAVSRRSGVFGPPRSQGWRPELLGLPESVCGGPTWCSGPGRRGPFSPLRPGRPVSGVWERGAEGVAAPACRFLPPTARGALRHAGRCPHTALSGSLRLSPRRSLPDRLPQVWTHAWHAAAVSVAQQGLAAPEVPVLRLLVPSSARWPPAGLPLPP